MYDLKITNGTIVDGTGARALRRRRRGEGRRRSWRCRESPLDGDAAETIDATGLLVTPGFVDVHTHYDGQATWDPMLEPSSGHGVTTVVAGQLRRRVRAGAPGRREVADQPDGGRRGHPRHRARRGHRLELGDVPRVPRRARPARVRHRRRRAGVARRGARVRDGGAGRGQRTGQPRRDRGDGRHRAGSGGGRCARLLDVAHARPPRDGRPAGARARSPPRTSCSRSGAAMAAGGRAVFELAPMGAAGEDMLAPKQEIGWMCRLADEIGMPVSFALLQVDAAPDLWRELMDESLRAHRRRRAGVPAGRGAAVRDAARVPDAVTASAVGPRTASSPARLSPDDLLAELAKPAVRAQILAEDDVAARPDRAVRRHVPAGAGRRSTASTRSATRPTTSRPPTAPSPRWRRRPASTRSTKLYDVMLEHDAQHLLMLPFFNYAERNHDAIREMLLHPGGCVGAVRRRRALLAHLRRVDSHVHAHALGARPHRGEQLPLEYLVKKQTSDTAALFGLGDRGVLAAGKKADVNVIDFERLSLQHAAPGARPARRRRAAPAGRRRLRRHDGERRGHPPPRRRHRRPPGRLLRGAR